MRKSVIRESLASIDTPSIETEPGFAHH